MADESVSDEWIFGEIDPSDMGAPEDEGEHHGPLPWWEDLRHELGEVRAVQISNPDYPRPSIGRFEGIRYRSRGGFGVVFMARDPEFDRHVALKFCLVPGEETRETLLQEAKLLAQLSHPNVVTVHETGWYGPNLFFAMEYIEGKTAHEFIFELPSWEEIVAVYAGAGAGLAAAHRNGIVHGDFKPENILLGHDNWPRLADFGLAHREASGGEKRIGGTKAFAAPEVLMGLLPDARSDQWSFCVALLQTFAFGELPFAGETDEELLRSMMAGLGELPPELPAGFRGIMRRGLALEPSERYPDMQALLTDFRRAQKQEERRQEQKQESEASRSSSTLAPAWDFQASQVPPVKPSVFRQLASHAVVCGVTALLAVALLGPGRGMEAQREETPSVAEPVQGQPTSQCHTRDTAINSISSELESVCMKIRDGEFKEANSEWVAFREREYPEKDAAGYDIAIMELAAATKVTADTFEEQASTLSDASAAKSAHEYARFMTTRYLRDYQNLEPPAAVTAARAPLSYSKHSAVPSALDIPHSQARNSPAQLCMSSSVSTGVHPPGPQHMTSG